MKWLGDSNPFYEKFPSCDLNEKQVGTIVNFSEVRVSGLGVAPAIRKLTDTGIVEISVKWSKTPDDFGSGGKLWLADDGEFIACAIWEGAKSDAKGPIRVYRWTPEQRKNAWRSKASAEQVVYADADGIRDGAYEMTRQFIKQHWDNTNTTEDN